MDMDAVCGRSLRDDHLWVDFLNRNSPREREKRETREEEARAGDESEIGRRGRCEGREG